ncbi:MAG: hypothetical protein WAO61_00825 [Solirubrobacterales bacterium]
MARTKKQQSAGGGRSAPSTGGAVDYASFAESMMDTSLYGVGAYFCDRHPELADDVIAESDAIEEVGLRAYAEANNLTFDECLQTLLTGLAVRYYNAIVG